MLWLYKGLKEDTEKGRTPMNPIGFSKAQVIQTGAPTKSIGRVQVLAYINRFFMFGSSHAQKTSSLSSCEADLHAMVSTLADGIYIKRCLAFLIQADAAHYLMTDSSSARQLAAKRGVGKIRHLDGKILWVQQHVLAGDVFFNNCQQFGMLPISAQSLCPQQRIKLLLHELNVCKDGGTTVIGQDVHDEHVQRNGSQRQVMQLAENLMRVF